MNKINEESLDYLVEAFCPAEIEEQSICIDGDIKEVLDKITF